MVHKNSLHNLYLMDVVAGVQPVRPADAAEAGRVPAARAARPLVAAHVRRVLGVDLAVLGTVQVANLKRVRQNDSVDSSQ